LGVGGISILLVENNGPEKTSTGEVFERLGHRLSRLHDPAFAMERVEAEHYELVVLDLNLNGSGGLSLLKKIKGKKESLPVVIVSADPKLNDAVEAMKLGARDFLLKPLTPDMVKHLLFQLPRALKADTEDPEDRYRILTNNPRMRKLLEDSRDIADSKASVFIQGDSGTGKELLARYIHRHSSRKDKPFVAVNCSALPETLLESELLGHEKGAFTGAFARKKGKFEFADQGTILLDEISEMDFQLQSKLLRVLQEKEVDRIGGDKPVPVDVRVIATSNKKMETLLQQEKFREDLFYRLNVIPLHIPPLRERRDDIPLLIHHFVEKYNRLENRAVKGLADDAVDALVTMPWKGNVRELENIVARGVLLCKGERVEKKELFFSPIGEGSGDGTGFMVSTVTLREMERKAIFNTLNRTNGNRTHAAEILGISVRTLRNKLHEYKEEMEKL
jgi:DNA-binding NtrC family response regulator